MTGGEDQPFLLMVLLHKDKSTALIRSPGHERPKVAGSSQQPLRSISPLTTPGVPLLCLLVLAPAPIDELRSQLGPSQKAVDGWLLLLLHYLTPRPAMTVSRLPLTLHPMIESPKVLSPPLPPLPHVRILSSFPCVTSVKSVHAALPLHACAGPWVMGHGSWVAWTRKVQSA